MAYLGVVEAFRSRLAGNSPEHVPSYPGLPQIPDPSSEVPGRDINYADVLREQMRETKVFIDGLFSVPIYPFGPEWSGDYPNVYPSLAFDIIGVRPRYDAETVYYSSKYGGEGYVIPVSYSLAEVRDVGASQGTGSRMAKTRALEHPFDILVEVKALAKDPVEAAVLISYIYKVLPPRHFLRVPHKDGSHRSWNLFHTDYADLDQRGGIKTGVGGEQEYAKAFTYRVMAKIDNTDETELVNFIRARQLLFEKTA